VEKKQKILPAYRQTTEKVFTEKVFVVVLLMFSFICDTCLLCGLGNKLHITRIGTLGLFILLMPVGLSILSTKWGTNENY